MLDNIILQQIATSFLVLFAVIDIIGSIPIIVTLKKQIGKIEAKKATFTAGILLISFLFIGDKILKLIGIDVNSFAIAGAFVLFIIAIEMILGIQIQKNSTNNSGSIVPIAFPLIAGAGSLTTTLSLKAEFHNINIIIAIILNMLIVYIILKIAGKLEKILGKGTIEVLNKVFGVILLAISVKLFSSNIFQLFENL